MTTTDERCDRELLHPVQRLLADVDAALDATGDPALFGLGDGEVEAVLAGLDRAASRLRSHALGLAVEADRRGRPRAVGATCATLWLSQLLHATPSAAARAMAHARALDTAGLDPVTAPIAADARIGAVGVEHAAVAAEAVAALPPDLDAPERARCVAAVRDAARDLDPAALRRVGQHLLHVIDPDRADEVLARHLAREEAAATVRRALVIGAAQDGLVRGRFALPAADAAALTAALRPLAAPRPAGDPVPPDAATADPAAPAGWATPVDRAATAPVADDPWAGAAGPGVAGTGPGGEPRAAARDERTHAQRMADALVDLATRALAQGDLPVGGGERPQLVVTVTLDQLRRATTTGSAATTGSDNDNGDRSGTGGTGQLLDGTDLSPATLRRLACDAGVVPAVLGGAGQPLDIGRETRVVPTGLRRALVLRDRGCAFPGCDRPPAWTDAHHIRHWADGGGTSLPNLVLLCGHHHRYLHGHTGWEVRVRPDGRVEWLPPPWLDPVRRPVPARQPAPPGDPW